MDVVKINGAEYELKFNIRTLKEYKQITGESLLNDADNFMDRVGELTLAAIRSANKNATITLDEVEEGLSLGDMPGILQAFTASIPQAEEKNG